MKFTGEDCTQYEDSTLPTLDTALWVENGVVQHMFYEKPTVGNQVLNKETSLPTACMRASLVQETVPKLLNCSQTADDKVKSVVLGKFARRLVNSGHSPQSSHILLVQGVTKYLHKVKLSELHEEDPKYVPLYVDKKYREDERQFDKYLAKMNWYRSRK